MGTNPLTKGGGMERRMEMRERELMKRLNKEIKTFYDDQLKRDEEVLSFLKKKRGSDGS